MHSAAESLNLTQPAVSAKIKSLESDLKVSLFDRLGRQIQLTAVGQYLVDEAKKLVSADVNFKDSVEIEGGRSIAVKAIFSG
ncbi:MAG: LysR family transcriptional regulator [Cyanobacteria bacterium J06649_11]